MRPVVYVAVAADVTAGFTPPVPVDYMRVTGMYAISYLTKSQGPGGGTVQYSADDPFTNPSLANITGVTGDVTLGSNTILNLSSTANLAVGQTVTSVIGTYIPAGTTITKISGTTLTISNNATVTQTGIGLNFSGMTWTTVTMSSGQATINQGARAFRVSSPTAGDVLTIMAQGGSPAG